MSDRSVEILVLGAGLTGAGVALELAGRGVEVTLLDQDAVALNRASLRNEGKIHLGFIYANDPGRATASLQVEGALRFRRIVSGWTGGDGWLVRSTPFHYLVAADSLLEPDALAAHYAWVEARIRERLAEDPGLDYLGLRPDRMVARLGAAALERWFDPARFAAGFDTGELAVDTDPLARGLRQAIARDARITFLPSRRARAAARTREGFVVEGDGPNGTWRIRAEQVVNATWERRLGLDAQLGLPAPPQVLHRLKYRVIARLPAALRGAPSVSMVLGRYGDVVVRPDGTVFLSWYPVGLRGWSEDPEPPTSWEDACRGEPPAAEAAAMGSGIVAAIGAWYRGVDACVPGQVDAGAIVAIGRSDVDDPASGLHDRTRVGVFSSDGWHSVDPGKLTTAPWFACAAADRVTAARAARRTLP
jgi:glycine/D-amino acid oxidase-like deaminating enzyme